MYNTLYDASELTRSVWFKHILFRRKGVGAAQNAQCPLQNYVQKNTTNPLTTRTHAHTHVIIQYEVS